MKKKSNNTVSIGCIVILIAILISWLLTCGVIKLITLCFGMIFSWKISTGIWLCFCLFNLCVSRHVTVKHE